MKKNPKSGKCKECGKTVPDKRPYCRECRQKKELERRIEEKKLEPKPVRAKIYAASITAILIIASLVFFINSYSNKPKEDGIGDLVIESDPPGAAVISLDNSFPSGKTPLKIEGLKAGKIYKFTFNMEACGNTNQINGVEIKKNQENKYKAVLEKQGGLHIQTIPPGADIYIDGIKTNFQTPAIVDKLKEGAKKIKLQFSDGTIIETVKNVVWKNTESVYLLKYKDKSGIQFNIPDGIKIYLDGQYIGKSPLPVALTQAGEHNISLISDKYMPLKTNFQSKSGEAVTFSPSLTPYGILEISANRRAYLYQDNKMMGALPLKVSCEPDKKFVADVVGEDGTSWKQGFILKPGEYRRVKAQLPDYAPSPTVVAAESSYTPPYTDFSKFELERFFPPSEWLKTEDFMEDMDLDGESERILGFTNLLEKGDKGYKSYAFIIKKHDEVFFDRIPLRNPRLGCLGEGEIISLEAVRSDKYGYREIVYSIGNAEEGITEKGSFAIYKGEIYHPSWSGR